MLKRVRETGIMETREKERIHFLKKTNKPLHDDDEILTPDIGV